MDNYDNIDLDVCCGSRKMSGWIGIDKRSCNGVDIVHDVTVIPWPLSDSCCSHISMSGAWGCIEPKYRIDIMNEMWRIARPGCILKIEDQHIKSLSKYHDPTYYGGLCVKTFYYFDPSKTRYSMYEPKPWKIVDVFGMFDSTVAVSLEVIK